MTREEFAYELEIQPRFFSSGEFDCNDTNALDLAEKLFCIIDSLEQQNTALQARIKELEEPKTCDGCEHHRTDDDFPYCSKYENNASFVCERLHFKDMFEPKRNK